MGGEFLVQPLSTAVEKSTAFSFSNTFDEHFAYYLSAGMSYELYWKGDCTLVKAYRKAEELKKKTENYNAWLQGLYFYDALIRVSPIFHAFAAKGAKPEEYVNEPYPINKEEREMAEEKKQKAIAERGLNLMKRLMERGNE